MVVNVVIAEGLTVKTGVSADISQHVSYDFYRADARDIENFSFALEVAVVVFILKGNIAFAKNDSVAGMPAPEDADVARENGIRNGARVDPLAPGNYQARVSFQDSDHRPHGRTVGVGSDSNAKVAASAPESLCKETFACSYFCRPVAIGLPAAAHAQGGDQIKLGTDLVEIRAVVTDAKGRPVLGLTKDDFDVVDGGRAQQLDFFSQERVSSAPAAATGATGDAGPSASSGPDRRPLRRRPPSCAALARERQDGARDVRDTRPLGPRPARNRHRIGARPPLRTVRVGPLDPARGDRRAPARAARRMAREVHAVPRLAHPAGSARRIGRARLRRKAAQAPGASGSSSPYEDVAIDRSYRARQTTLT